MGKKGAVLGFLLVSIMIFLSSCRQEPPPVSGLLGQPDADALSFRITWTDYSGRGEAIQRIVDSYNLNRSETILMIGGDENLDAIEQMLDSKQPVIYVLPYRYVKYFGSKGKLLDLTAAFLEERSVFYPQVWDLGGVDGKTFGIPWLGHSMCLLYNKTLLGEAGVDASSINSLTDLVSAMEKVEQHTDAKGIGLVGAGGNDISWMVNQFMYGFGASLVSEDGRSVTINSDQSRDAINFYRSVLGGYAQETWLEDTGTEVMSHFLNGKVAFEIQGIWGVTDIKKNGSPFDVGIIALPDIGLRSEVGPMMLALPEGLEEKALIEALSFIRYMISSQAQQQILLGEYSPEHDAYYLFRTPIRMDLAGDNTFRNNPEYIKFIEGFQSPSIDVPVPAWQEVKDRFYGPGLHKVMKGEMAVDEFLAQIEAEGSQILQRDQ